MGEYFFVVLVVLGIALSIAGKIRKALAEEAERARELAKKQQNARAGGEPPVQKKPELQTLLETLARKAEARDVAEQGHTVVEQQEFEVAPQRSPEMRAEPFPEEDVEAERADAREAVPLGRAYRGDSEETYAPPQPAWSSSEGRDEAAVKRRGRKAHGKRPRSGGARPKTPTAGALGGEDAYGHIVVHDGARPSERLARVLQGRRFWQQAVLLRELLGVPRSGRPYGDDDRAGLWG